MRQVKYENTDLSELHRKTNTPFAIDNTGITDHQKYGSARITRPRGIGSIEYVVCGKGTVTENDKTFQVKAGDVFLLHPRQYHDYYPDPDDPWVKIWLQISGNGVPEILRMYGLSKVNHIPDFDLSEEVTSICEKIKHDTDTEIIDREGPILLIQLMQSISGELKKRSKQEASRPIAFHARELIENSLDGNVTLEQLAKNFHVSKHHLVRLFKQEYGITPHEYILNHRIGIAQSLLKRTSLTMQEIANQMNFCDAAYFSDFFRRQTGMTPLQFRKKYK